MVQLAKADAARQLGISRTTLYKLIDQGKVSATPDGLINETELVRAASYVDTLKERARTSMDNTDMDTILSHDEHRERPPEPVHERSWAPVHERQWTSTDPLVAILREQLQRAHERERAYEERERTYHEHLARLTAMLHEAQQQNQRLLNIPRSAPVPAFPGSGDAAAPDLPRGEIRRRIVALGHYEALRRA
jgi:excisionase family DNA binding protein